jgi:hypothetical protein
MRNRIHPRTGQSLLDELGDGGLQDVLAGFLGVVLARLARRFGGFHAGLCHYCHAGSRPSLVSGNYDAPRVAMGSPHRGNGTGWHGYSLA